MKITKGKKYIVISNKSDYFKKGEIVISLEEDCCPYCVSEIIFKAHDESIDICDYSHGEFWAIDEDELEEVEEKHIPMFLVGDKVIINPYKIDEIKKVHVPISEIAKNRTRLLTIYSSSSSLATINESTYIWPTEAFIKIDSLKYKIFKREGKI